MQKRFTFEKIAYSSLRKANAVDVDVELKETDKGYVFTASGHIWNSRHTDLYCSGQCLDEINKYLTNQTFKKIYEYWKKYHLNDMHAGTEKQELEVNNYFMKNNKKYDFDEACEYLKSINLYEDNGYRYGSSWLYREISEDDLKDIKHLLVDYYNY